MPRRGSWEMRNAAFKARHARRYAEARTDADRLAAAFDWFRSSAALLERRRVPQGRSQEDNRIAAGRIVREVTEHLAGYAQAVDRGEFDTGRR